MGIRDSGISDILSGNVKKSVYKRVFDADFDERITAVSYTHLDVYKRQVGDREQIIELLRHFHYESANVPQTVIKTSGRELNNS